MTDDINVPIPSEVVIKRLTEALLTDYNSPLVAVAKKVADAMLPRIQEMMRQVAQDVLDDPKMLEAMRLGFRRAIDEAMQEEARKIGRKAAKAATDDALFRRVEAPR